MEDEIKKAVDLVGSVIDEFRNREKFKNVCNQDLAPYVHATVQYMGLDRVLRDQREMEKARVEREEKLYGPLPAGVED